MPFARMTCVYKKVQHCSIKADVFLPESRRPAVLVYIHGGALISGSRKYLSRYQARQYLNAGFAVVAIDYRLAPETRLEYILDDIRDSFQWIRGEGAKTFNFDPQRIAVAGGSAGGYLSLMSGTFVEKPKAIVSFYGYGDILGNWYTKPSAYYCETLPLISKSDALASVGNREISAGTDQRYQYYFYTRQQGIWPEAVSGLSLQDDQLKLMGYCPLYNIGKDYPPTLLLHGDHDTDVPCDQSIQMSKALSARGIKNKLIIIEKGEHGFDQDRKNPQVRGALQEVISFLQENVLGNSQG